MTDEIDDILEEEGTGMAEPSEDDLDAAEEPEDAPPEGG